MCLVKQLTSQIWDCRLAFTIAVIGMEVTENGEGGEFGVGSSESVAVRSQLVIRDEPVYATKKYPSGWKGYF